PSHGRAAPAGTRRRARRRFTPIPLGLVRQGHRRLPQRHYRATGRRLSSFRAPIADTGSLYFLRPLFAPKVKIPPPSLPHTCCS
ncbi:hypothetical protein WMY93_033282, partial [Mugilogobius chulae]